MNDTAKIPAIIFILILILQISFLTPELGDLGGDNAQYIFLAESISQGTGYRSINYPNSPPHTKYPFVFPFMLVPIVVFFGENLILMHLLIIFLSFLSTFLSYINLKKYLEKDLALILASLIGTSPLLLSSLIRILSDIPYLFFTLPGLIYLQGFVDSKEIFDKRFFLGALFLLLSYFTRTIGITLFFGTLTYLFSKVFSEKDFGFYLKKASLLSAFFLIPVIAWSLRCLFLSWDTELTPSYHQEFFLINPYKPEMGNINISGFLQRFSINSQFYMYEIARVLFYSNERLSPWPGLSALILVLLFFIGYLNCLINKKRLSEYYIFFYIVTLPAWFFCDPRFLLPILPFIFYYFIEGILLIQQRLNLLYSSKRLPDFIIGVLFLSNLLGAYQEWGVIHRGEYYSQMGRNFIVANEWIRKNVREDVIVLSRKPSITTFFSKKKSIIYPFSLNPDSILNFIDKNKIDYLIVDEFSYETKRYLVPVLKRFPFRFKYLNSFGDTALYGVVKY